MSINRLHNFYCLYLQARDAQDPAGEERRGPDAARYHRGEPGLSGRVPPHRAQERIRVSQVATFVVSVYRVVYPVSSKTKYCLPGRRDILKTEQCLARQLESSMSAGQIIQELNDLENSNSFSRRSKIWVLQSKILIVS